MLVIWIFKIMKSYPHNHENRSNLIRLREKPVSFANLGRTFAKLELRAWLQPAAAQAVPLFQVVNGNSGILA